jgi:histidine triad (HIT) family protein
MHDSDPGNCVFCKIAAGSIPSTKLFEDELVLGFKDLNPQSPVHVLLIPRKHIATLDDASEEDGALLARLMFAAQRTAADLAVGGAYRLVNNCGETAGQSVFHLHFHLLAGRALRWPPG